MSLSLSLSFSLSSSHTFTHTRERVCVCVCEHVIACECVCVCVQMLGHKDGAESDALSKKRGPDERKDGEGPRDVYRIRRWQHL